MTVMTLDRGRFARLADGIVVACAIVLPWSTSATGILIAVWLAALVPTLTAASMRGSLATPAGGLPVLLCLLAIAGLAWSDAALLERLEGLVSFCRLLAIPLLLVQFRSSNRGKWVIGAYFLSCLLLLCASYVDLVFHANPERFPGVPVRDYILQSGEFQLCIAGILYLAVEAGRCGRRLAALGYTALAVPFLANIAFVVTSRTALVVMPALVVVFGLRQFSRRGLVTLVCGSAALAGILWVSSPYLRTRVEQTMAEVQQALLTDHWQSSSGVRVEMWRTSVQLIEEAPILGHGTGSIGGLFARAAAQGRSVLSTRNPHQQIMTVAIQLGLIGVAALIAVWFAHFRLFDGPGITAWCGAAVVVQTVISSQFNSYLFDFGSGWTYIWAVGVLGGTVLRERSLRHQPRQAAQQSDCALGI
jgi:O-antigen ligase